MARWGLYAVLLNAGHGDLVSPRYLDFGDRVGGFLVSQAQTDGDYPLRSHPARAFSLMCENGVIKFFHPKYATDGITI
ncbi:MAG: hypothetical protein GWN13_13335, partial [Phycisphaerae bacterium]|nr:hypothetical protein [Phycisphaerae bacterium]